MESLTWVLSFYLDLEKAVEEYSQFTLLTHSRMQTTYNKIHGLNEELGRHSSRNSSKACVFCECECEFVEHVLWECSEYSSIHKEFIGNLDGFLLYNRKNNMKKMSAILFLGCGLWSLSEAPPTDHAPHSNLKWSRLVRWGVRSTTPLATPPSGNLKLSRLAG